mmetsp:Transcript_9802/g.22945  ORF Transcript_9802/g.22945 Transcript_9802/m.22945 type:complete len:93 (+) Transcript_9802:484-762(+)
MLSTRGEIVGARVLFVEESTKTTEEVANGVGRNGLGRALVIMFRSASVGFEWARIATIVMRIPRCMLMLAMAPTRNTVLGLFGSGTNFGPSP